jgi:uncharacterized protein (TIGR02118 family)
MAKLQLAIWRDPAGEPAAFQRDLAEGWAGRLLAEPRVAGLKLHRAAADLRLPEAPAAAGAPGERPPDALASLWLPEELLAPLARALRGEASAARGALPLPGGAEQVWAWRVHEVRQIAYRRSWPDGEESPGIANVSLVRPAPGKSLAEFTQHWELRHGPLAKRVHVGLSGYVQNQVREALTVGGRDVFGVGELHFRSLRDFHERMFGSEEGRREVFEDIPRFMSLADTLAANMTELVLRTPPEHRAG